MKLKKLIGMFMIMFATILTIGAGTTYAANASYILGITNIRESGGAYGIGIKSNNTVEKKIWKIVSYPTLSSNTIDYSNAFYCIKAEHGFAMQGTTNVAAEKRTYSTKYDMKTQKQSVLTKLQAIDVFKTDPTSYNKIMWIVDNMYLPKAPGAEQQKIALLTNAGILDADFTIEDAQITDEDIEVVQQLALWYFTNPNDNPYNSETLPILAFNNKSGKDEGYNTFAGLYDNPSSVPEIHDGTARQMQCAYLYNYLITTAKQKGSYTSSDAVAPLSLDKTRVALTEETDGYLIGPFRINQNSTIPYNIDKLNFTDETGKNFTYTMLNGNKQNISQITLGQDFYIRVPLNTTVKTIRFDFGITYTRTTATYYTTDENTYRDNQPVILVEKGVKPANDHVSVQIPEQKPFDLSLRKFISEVNGKVPTISREPVVDVSKLKAKTATTAIYNHPKTILEVPEEATITYTIRVYNEGEKDGYASEITDHLPEELEFLPNDSQNKSYGWHYDETDASHRTIKTNYLSKANNEKNIIKGYDGGDNLYYKEIKVRCKLKQTTLEGKRIVNIADITGFTDQNGNGITDRDSQAKNVSIPQDSQLPNYKLTEVNRKDQYIPGQQDDDDFDNVYIKVKSFDLALRKFISGVNGVKPEISREPVVDISGLVSKNSTTAIYNHPKAPLSVEVGDIITYTIRIYNEGEKDGYASEITDHLPEQLAFLPEDEQNIANGWVYDDKDTTLRTIKTNHLSRTTDTENKIKAFDGKTLDYKDVFVRCQVVASPTYSNRIVNIADITEFTDKNGNTIIDRDSQANNLRLPTNEELPNYKQQEINRADNYIPGQQDDDDFDNVRITYFDLALRKFISVVNGKIPTISREPVVDISGLVSKNSTTAIYNHPKTPLEVKVGDIVTYTIRVYNEGKKDGYASEITDHLPPQLEFLPQDKQNIANGWVYDENDASNRTIKTNHLSKQVSENNRIKAFDGQTLSYKDITVNCKVVGNPKYNKRIVNIADITDFTDEDGNAIKDVDSSKDNVTLPSDETLPNYKETEIERGDKYIPGQQDDDDFDSVKIGYFDLALRKFITKVDDLEYNNRYPQLSMKEDGNIQYTHTKEPVSTANGSIVTYNIRVYNEGTIAGYATEITDDLPEGLQFLPQNDTNKEYRWKMIDKEGKETEHVEEAVKITTDYLSKAQEKQPNANLLKAFNAKAGLTDTNPDYREVKIAFKVTEPNTSDRILINTAEISEDSDANGDAIDDVDSTPGNNKEGEDDIDIEKVKVKYFDLALKKWVTQSIVIQDGKQTIVETGHTGNENPEPVVKVDLKAKDLSKVTVKFRYKIKVTNEGELEGYVKELKDYIPDGLRFDAKDNPKWKQISEKVVTTDQLKDQLLRPKESATVEIVLTWENSDKNLGLKVNWAEISKDYNEYDDTPDIDSTPDNRKLGEDDIDNAPVILAIKTGEVRMYMTLTAIILITLAGGIYMIKKFVL